MMGQGRIVDIEAQILVWADPEAMPIWSRFALQKQASENINLEVAAFCTQRAKGCYFS